MKLATLVGLAAVLFASSSIGCGAGEVSEPTPGSQSDVSTAPISPPPSGGPSGAAGAVADQIAAGQTKFSSVCARCHGPSGEGRSGPRLIGLDSGALSRFKNAEEVATYAANNMPVSSKLEAYAVVAFLVKQNGIANDRVLDTTVATTIALH